MPSLKSVRIKGNIVILLRFFIIRGLDIIVDPKGMVGPFIITYSVFNMSFKTSKKITGPQVSLLICKFDHPLAEQIHTKAQV